MSKIAAKGARFTPKRIAVSIGMALALAGAGGAQAFSFDTGNSDVEVRWDNQVRYNAGWRVGEPNPHFFNTTSADETDLKFKRGDMVINRLDVFSELDFAYKKTSGFRVSAALWEDWAYRDKKSVSNPVFAPVLSNYRNNDFNAYTKRFVAGPSGEILDAFVYGGWDFGGPSLQLKLGQHNVYWGESMFSPTNGISYSQGPVDTLKAATSPGAEAKELFMPTQQLSGQLSLTGEIALLGQYAFDWRPFRLVPGGTYFAGSDGGRVDFGAPTIPNGGDIIPDKKRGDYGLGLRWSPEWLQGTLGAYYRKFDEKIPWNILTRTGAANTAIRLVYARDTELFGLSLNRPLGPISFGGELVFRKNTALNSLPGYIVGATAGVETTYAQAEGARGNTWHVLLNGAYILPKTVLWDTGSLAAELAYQKLDKITRNPSDLFGRKVYYAEGAGNNCVNGTLNGLAVTDHRNGCSTNSSLAMNVNFNPQWTQVFPGVDLSMPTSLAWGLRGNSPALGGTFEGAYAWSLGIQADYLFRHTFALKYVQPTHINYGTSAGALGATATVQNNSSGSGGVQNNHGWLSFSYKTAF